jgi:predicted DNA-binding protein
MKSVRLDADLEERLARAAGAEGVTESEFIREAVRRRCDDVLQEDLAKDLEELGIIGAVSLGGASARQSGKRFTEVLDARKERLR